MYGGKKAKKQKSEHKMYGGKKPKKQKVNTKWMAEKKLYPLVYFVYRLRYGVLGKWSENSPFPEFLIGRGEDRSGHTYLTLL